MTVFVPAQNIRIVKFLPFVRHRHLRQGRLKLGDFAPKPLFLFFRCHIFLSKVPLGGQENQNLTIPRRVRRYRKGLNQFAGDLAAFHHEHSDIFRHGRWTFADNGCED